MLSTATNGLKTTALAALMCGALCGCRDDAKVVFETARDTLEAKDVPGFLLLVTPKARAFLQRADDVSKRSGRTFRVLRDGAPTKALLPKGDVTDVVEQGRRCVVVVTQGRRKQQVPMRLVRGQWRIDLMEMDSFLAAMQPLD